MTYSTKQYQAVLHALESRPQQSMTAAELSDALRQDGCPVGLATIYRQLEKLEAAGCVHKVPTEEGALYQYCPHRHAHQSCFLLRCQDCGRIIHLDCVHLQSLYQHLEAEHHFRIDSHRTILTGLCKTCMESEATHGTH